MKCDICKNNVPAKDTEVCNICGRTFCALCSYSSEMCEECADDMDE